MERLYWDLVRSLAAYFSQRMESFHTMSRTGGISRGGHPVVFLLWLEVGGDIGRAHHINRWKGLVTQGRAGQDWRYLASGTVDKEGTLKQAAIRQAT